MKSLLLKLAVVLVTWGAVVTNGFAGDKVNATPKEIAMVLCHSLQKDMTGLADNQSFKEIFKVIKNPEIFKREIYFLKIFATDIGIMTSKHEEFLKDMVRKAFLNEVNESNFYLEKRFDAYTTALNTPHHLKVPYTVIRQFMDFCGYPLDAVIMFDVGIEFMGDLLKVNEFMKSIQIIMRN